MASRHDEGGNVIGPTQHEKPGTGTATLPAGTSVATGFAAPAPGVVDWRGAVGCNYGTHSNRVLLVQANSFCL